MLRSFGSWVYFLTKRNDIKIIKKRTTHNTYAVAWKEWKSVLRLIRLRKNTYARYHHELLENTFTTWYHLTLKAVTQRQELLAKLSGKGSDAPWKDDFNEKYDNALWYIAGVTNNKRRFRHMYVIFQTWKNVTKLVLFVVNRILRTPKKA